MTVYLDKTQMGYQFVKGSFSQHKDNVVALDEAQFKRIISNGVGVALDSHALYTSAGIHNYAGPLLDFTNTGGPTLESASNLPNPPCPHGPRSPEDWETRRKTEV